MQPADVHANRAAAVDIGADVFALFGIGDCVSLDPQPLRQCLGAARHGLVLFISECAFELSNRLEIARERFRLDEIVQELACNLAFRLDRQRLLFTEPSRERSVVRPNGSAGDATIARRSALPRIHCIKGRN
jgi:hypothetical protein